MATNGGVRWLFAHRQSEVECVKRLHTMLSRENLKARVYALPNCGQQLVLTPAVLEVFLAHRQSASASEAGGLLFAEFDLPRIRLVEASPPHKTDKRWRLFFIPNRLLQRRLVRKRFKQGRHFVGEWHTHPHRKPSPSGVDLDSMADAFLKSRHELNYFIMIIIGNETDRLELWASIHDGRSYHRLQEIG